MRIRMLAAAVVTAGALMATLTGAANADGTPTPVPWEGTVQIQCEGGGQAILTTRRLTEAEIKELAKAGSSPAVPAVPSGRADEAGVPSGHVKDFRRARTEGEDAKELPPLPESVTPGKDVKVMAAPSATAAFGAPEAGVVTVISEGAPERIEGAKRAEKVEGAEGPEDVAVMVMSTPSAGAPVVTCAKAKKE
ncbi:hypothetical protein [Streptosporangium amethystogenes]|uniref:hypothetical protein n=1 Tax=Streptosporangium amethystogenes TaxID=2002 RepID=UPI0004C85341|nr:hypothetical protein [Streptosporangium amethystogenes]